MKNDIATRIKTERIKYGWSQEEAGEFLGLTKRGYQAREQKGEFPLADVVRLAERFRLSLDYLLTGATDGYGLSEEEQRLIRGWRKIGQEDKDYIRGVITDALLEIAEKD